MSEIDPIALTADLVRIDSRNPRLVPGAPGEAAAARHLAARLERSGFEVQLQDTGGGRPNVIARAGPRGHRSLILTGPLDVVGVEGMTHEPFAADRLDGRISGRGSADMKSGIAAMCAAAARAAPAAAGEIIIAAVSDEEYQSAGTRALLAAGVRGEAAIVTEPTRLALCPAHRGFAWIEVTVRGRAAHGSRYDLGVDAIRHAGLLLAELDRIDTESLPRRTHRLLGHASLHASAIEGGLGWSTYPDACALRIERRLLPGENGSAALAEVEAACARVRERRASFEATSRLVFEAAPSDVPESAAVVRALGAAVEKRGLPVRVEGLSAWTDAALFNAAGIPAICFGPGDIALAHAAEEYVPEAEIIAAADVLESMIGIWFTAQRGE